MPIDAPIHTNETNLARVLNAGLPVALVFWSRDCAPCTQLNPVLDRLARTYAGKALIVKVNASEEAGLVRRYSIEALPSLVFLQQGRALATACGAAPESELAAWLAYVTSGGTQPPVPTGPAVQLAVPAGAGGPAPYGSPEPDRPGASGAPAAAAAGNGKGQPVVLTDANFDRVVRSSPVPVMVDFWAVWCGPCRMVAPVVEQLAHEYAGRALIGKLNVDENPAIASRYGIMSIPTLLIFRGGKVVDQIVGALPAPALRQRLAQQVPR
jgi:thioredoxin 1